MNVNKRKQLVRRNGACFKCLLQGYLIKNCKSQSRCQENQCNGTPCCIAMKRYHPVIYLLKETVADANAVSMTTRAAQFGQKKGTMSLPVKKVIVQNGSGRPIMINCLEDSGCQVTFITNRLVDILGIAKSKGQLILSGVCSQRIKLHDEVLVHVRP